MYEGAIQDLIDALGRLPGIGPKSAQRIAFHILQSDEEIAANLVEAVRTVKRACKFARNVETSQKKQNVASGRDPRRDGTKICVVEESKDVIAIERTREFRGKYHVLGGAISPIDGIGPDQLRIRELMQRLSDSSITEIILATDPNLEGEATATYIARLIKPMALTSRALPQAFQSVEILSMPMRSPLAVPSRGVPRFNLTIWARDRLIY
jgi:recombination protein RecR